MKKIKTLFGTGGLRILLPVIIVGLGLLGCAKSDAPGGDPGDGFGNGTSQQVVMPTFDPAGGAYTSGQTVTIATTTEGASIRYTVDGSVPSSTASTEYTGAVPVSATTTIKAIAYKDGMSDSTVAEATYTFALAAVAAPTFDPAGTTFTSTPQTVTISTTTNGATIKYTTDASDPVTSTTATEGTSVSVSDATTIKAYAYKTGMADSAVADATYTFAIVGVVSTPTFNPTGTFRTAQNVTISTITSGATIKYTTDGNDPSSTNGTVGTSVYVKDTLTIKAYAYKSGDTDSNIKSAPYIITRVLDAAGFIAGDYGTFDIILEAATDYAAGGQTTYDRYQTSPGHIPGAIYLHTKMAGSAPGRYIYEYWGSSDSCQHGRVGPRSTFEGYGDSIGLTSSSRVLIYGDFPTEYLFSTARAFWVFDYYGVEVYWLDGGKTAYTDAGGSLNTGVESGTAGSGYSASPDSTKIALEGEITATRDDLNISNDVANQVFFEARGSTAYTGTPYSTSHIPGAENVLESGNYDATTFLFKSLPAAYADAGISPTKDNIVYCGTGTVASGTYLYLKSKGYRIRNYAGSMHEWDTCLGRTVVPGSSPY